MEVLQDVHTKKGPSVRQPDNAKLPTPGNGTVLLSNELSTVAKAAMILPALIFFLNLNGTVMRQWV